MTKYAYQANDIGPSWDVMKQDIPEFRRITERLDAKETLIAEEHDLKLSMRARALNSIPVVGLIRRAYRWAKNIWSSLSKEEKGRIYEALGWSVFLGFIAGNILWWALN